LKALGIIAIAIAAALVTFALPVKEWGTGDQGLAPLDSVPEAATPPFPRRVWIDTDAACGHAPRTDPDDCFAIALLARSSELEIAGISTVAGNAAHDVVEATTRALVAQLASPVPVYSGAEADVALTAALERGPLTILALGPLTNLARVLENNPALAKRVPRLVAVMGRRPGHLFHPAEGAGGGILFGHGPVFRDFNFALDPQAAARVLALRVPMSLVPYDAARGIELTAADLDRLETFLPWIVPRARGWLEYWRSDIGRAGFYPFDLLAAAYVLEPSWLRCTPVRAWVGKDDTLFLPWAPAALLIEPGPGDAVLYCGSARARADIKANLMRRLTATRPASRAAANVRRKASSSS
jgi:purine nucleosidase